MGLVGDMNQNQGKNNQHHIRKDDHSPQPIQILTESWSVKRKSASKKNREVERREKKRGQVGDDGNQGIKKEIDYVTVTECAQTACKVTKR